MEKYLSKIKQKHYGIVSAVLAMVGIYIIFSLCQYVNSGKFIIMDSDLIVQYIPYIKMFLRDLLNGESIWYSWNVSLGMNTSLVNAYYALSPFNLLYLIFWNVDENIITTIIIVLKVGLSAYTFHMFLNRVVKRFGVETILCSLMYSLSTYVVLYGHMYNSWLEALYMLPLICVFIYELGDKKSYLKLIIAYAYMFVTQFYFAYMVGIFSFVFWLLLLVVREKKTWKGYLKEVIKYIGTVLWAVGISAVIIVPTFLFVLNHSAQDASTFEPLSTFLHDIYYSLFWGNKIPTNNTYPVLYCSGLALILVPTYFMSHNISAKEKIGVGILTTVLLLTMIIDPFYRFMHAFDAPDYYNFRHSFLLVFVLCAISCRQMEDCKTVKTKVLFVLVAIQIVAFPILNWLVGDVTSNYEMRMVVNCIIPIVWFGIWYLQKKGKIEKKTLALCAIVVIMAELISNGWYGIVNPVARLKAEYDCWKEGIESATEVLNEDSDFYRTYYDNDMSDNSDSWFGYNGIDDFCSAENYEVRQALRFLGLYTTVRRTCHFGITPPTEMILGVKYSVDGPMPYMPYEEDNKYEIIENPYYLGLGFMAEEEVLDYQYGSWVVFDNINDLLSTLSGEEIICYKPFDDSVMVTCTQAEISPEDSAIVVSYNPEDASYGMVTYYIEKEDTEQPVYVQFVNDYSIALDVSPYLYLGEENNVYQFGLLSVQYAKRLVENEGRYEASIVFNHTTASEWSYREAVFYEYDEAALERAYNILSNNCMNVEEYADGYVKANVTVPADKKVLFTTIPYDAGWTVYVDGKSADIKTVLEGAFIAVELEPGYHELEFKYEAPGVLLGKAISGVSLALYIMLIISCVVEHKRKKSRC